MNVADFDAHVHACLARAVPVGWTGVLVLVSGDGENVMLFANGADSEVAEDALRRGAEVIAGRGPLQ